MLSPAIFERPPRTSYANRRPTHDVGLDELIPFAGSLTGFTLMPTPILEPTSSTISSNTPRGNAISFTASVRTAIRLTTTPGFPQRPLQRMTSSEIIGLRSNIGTQRPSFLALTVNHFKSAHRFSCAHARPRSWCSHTTRLTSSYRKSHSLHRSSCESQLRGRWWAAPPCQCVATEPFRFICAPLHGWAFAALTRLSWELIGHTV